VVKGSEYLKNNGSPRMEKKEENKGNAKTKTNDFYETPEGNGKRQIIHSKMLAIGDKAVLQQLKQSQSTKNTSNISNLGPRQL
jgi:hypothetical protein